MNTFSVLLSKKDGESPIVRLAKIRQAIDFFHTPLRFRVSYDDGVVRNIRIKDAAELKESMGTFSYLIDWKTLTCEIRSVEVDESTAISSGTVRFDFAPVNDHESYELYNAKIFWTKVDGEWLIGNIDGDPVVQRSQ